MTKKQKRILLFVTPVVLTLLVLFLSYQWNVLKEEEQTKERIRVEVRLYDRLDYSELTLVQADVSKRTVTLSFKDRFNQLSPEAKYVVLRDFQDALETFAKQAESYRIYGQMLHGKPLVYLEEDRLYNKNGNQLVMGADIDEWEDGLSTELSQFKREVQPTYSPPVKKKGYSDSHCNSLSGQAKSDCLLNVMNAKCGQYMGFDGKEPQYVRMESCIREHISPENEFE